MNVLELSGGESLQRAVGNFAPSDSIPDIVVMRGAADGNTCVDITRCTTDADGEMLDVEKASDILTSALDLPAATDAIEDLWQHVRYSDYTPGIYFRLFQALATYTERKPHIDVELDGNSTAMKVMITGSLCVRGARTIHAQGLPQHFVRPDGSFSKNEYMDYAWNRDNLPQPLRSCVRLDTGDLALWGQNPLIVAHAVTEGTSDAAAVLLDWWVSRQ